MSRTTIVSTASPFPFRCVSCLWSVTTKNRSPWSIPWASNCFSIICVDKQYILWRLPKQKVLWSQPNYGFMTQKCLLTVFRQAQEEVKLLGNVRLESIQYNERFISLSLNSIVLCLVYLHSGGWFLSNDSLSTNFNHSKKNLFGRVND